MLSTIALVIAIVAVIAILVAVAIAVRLAARRRAIRQRYGAEYDRLAEAESPGAAEKELLRREERHRQLELRDLDEPTRERYRAEWTEIQAGFVDRPGPTVAAADELVTRLIADIGYPTADFDEQMAQLSVDHAETLDRYRQAHHLHLIQERGEATADQQREAIVHYRALFAELLDADPVVTEHARPGDATPVTPTDGVTA